MDWICSLWNLKSGFSFFVCMYVNSLFIVLKLWEKGQKVPVLKRPYNNPGRAFMFERKRREKSQGCFNVWLRYDYQLLLNWELNKLVFTYIYTYIFFYKIKISYYKIIVYISVFPYIYIIFDSKLIECDKVIHFSLFSTEPVYSKFFFFFAKV